MIVLVCYLLVWAFILSWISNMVLREDIPVGTSFVIMLFTGAVLIIYQATVAKGDALMGVLSIPLGAGVLGLGLKAKTQGDLKKCLLIGAIFAVLWWGIQLMVLLGVKAGAS